MIGRAEGWRLTTVGDAGLLQLGRQRAPRYHSGTNMKPYLRVANVFEDHIDLSDVMSMHFDLEEFERFRLHDGDVLLNEGQTPELLGRAAIYREHHGELAFTNSLIRFRANAGVDPRWALVVFRHHMHSGRFKREARITTNIAHLSLGRLRNVEFPVPPLDEQRRIVAILEDHLSRLDAAEASLTSAGQRLDVMRRGVMQAAIRGDLAAPIGREQNRRTHLVSRAALYPAAAKRGRPEPVSAVNRTSNWPRHWAQLSLEEATHPVRTVSYGILKPGPDVDGGVPYVRVVNMRDDVLAIQDLHRTTTEIASQYERATLAAGDVLISIRGTYGRVTVVPDVLDGANITQDTARLAFIGGVLPSFAAIYLRSLEAQAYLKRVARGVAVKGVNIGDLRQMPFPLPPLEEQRAIVARVEELLSDVDAASTALDSARRRSQQLRRSLLAAAFEGKLVRKRELADV